MDAKLYDKAKDIASEFEQAVDDPELKLVLVESKADKDWAARPMPDISFGIEAGASLSILALNAPNDKDPLGVFGTPPDGDAPEGVTWQPVLRPGAGTVWLQYLGTCHLKLGVGAKAGFAALKVDSAAALRVASYMPHRQPYPSVATAVRTDLSGLPHVFEAGLVQRLTVDQAVAVDLAGSMSASLTLDWADLLGGLVDPLGGLASAGSALALRFKANAQVQMSLGITGAYRVVFRGLEDGWIQLQLLANRQRSMELGIEAGLTVGFADPDAAQSVLRELVGELLGGDPDTIDQWKEAVGQLLDKLNAAHDGLLAHTSKPGDILSAYFDSLGLSSKLERLNAFNERVRSVVQRTGSDNEAIALLAEDLGASAEQAATLIAAIRALPASLTDLSTRLAEAFWERLGLNQAEERIEYALERLVKIEQAIARAAKAQVKIRFDYEYSHTEDDAALLSIELAPRLTAEQFQTLHTDALKLDGQSILAFGSAHLDLVRNGLLLGHRIETRRRSFGFTLGVNRWSASARWIRVRKQITLRRETTSSGPMLRHSVLGQRSYEGKGFYSGIKYAGDMALAMTDYQALGAATAGWTTALNLDWVRVYAKLGDSFIDELADHAALWSVIDAAEVSTLALRLKRELGGARVRSNLELTISAEAFQSPALHQLLAGNLDSAWAQALAGALPWDRGFDERRSLRDRERYYSGVTPLLLDSRYIGLGALPIQVTASIGIRLHEQGASRQLIRWERLGKAKFGTVEYLVHMHRGLLRDWPRMQSALAKLTMIPTVPVSQGLELANRVVQALDDAWDDSYSMRAFGRLLILLCAQAEMPPGAVTPRLVLEKLNKKDEVQQSLLVVPG